MKSLQDARHLVFGCRGTVPKRTLPYCLTASWILFTCIFLLPAQVSAETLSAERKEAAALLKRLEKYEQKYIDNENKVARARISTPSELDTPSPDKNVYNQQQERLVGEILNLRKKVQRLEAEAEQEIDKNDFSSRETELIEEIRRERLRAEKFEKDLVDYKRKETKEIILKRALSDSQGELEMERLRSKKKDKTIQELKKDIETLQTKVQQAEQVRQKYSSTQKSAQQLQLRVESQKNLESDNQYLRRELQTLKSKLAKVKSSGSSSDSSETVRKLQSRIESADQQLLLLTRSNKKLKDELTEARVDVEKSRQALLKSRSVKEGLKESEEQLSLVQKELQDERNKAKQLATELQSSNEKIASLEEKGGTLTSTLKLTAQQARGSASQLEAAKTKTLHLERELAAAKTQVAAHEAELARLAQTEEQVSTLNMTLNKEKLRAEQCEMQVSGLQSSSQHVRELEQKLLAAQNELLLKDTAMEVLGKGPTRKQREVRAKMSSIAQAQSGNAPLDSRSMATKRMFEAAQKTLMQSGAAPASSAGASGASNGVLIVEVQGEKVNLRNGPGVEHSPVMQVAQGTRLTVESRQGDWFRVFTPTGGRAFVRVDMVQNMPSTSADSASMISTPGVPSAVGASPSKPVARGIQPQTSLVPFGKVKVAGNPGNDLEDAALEALRTIGQKSESQ